MTEENTPSNTTDQPQSLASAPCPPWVLLREVVAKDQGAVDEIKHIEPRYSPPPAMTDLHARIAACLEAEKEIEQLLHSAKCIADREGKDTNWGAFAASLQKIGISGITARTYRAFEANDSTEAQP